MAQVEKGWWLPDDLVADEDKDLVSVVTRELEWDIPKIRALVVAVLEDANDSDAAVQVVVHHNFFQSFFKLS